MEAADGFAGGCFAMTGAEASVSADAVAADVMAAAAADVMAAATAVGEAAGEAAGEFSAFAHSNTGMTMPCKAAAAAASAAVSPS